MRRWEDLAVDERSDWLDDEITSAAALWLEQRVAAHTAELVSLAGSHPVKNIRYAAGRLRGLNDALLLFRKVS